MTDTELRAAGEHIIATWIVQLVTLECGHTWVTASATPYRANQYKHCHKCRANKRIVAVEDATAEEREAVTKDGNAKI